MKQNSNKLVMALRETINGEKQRDEFFIRLGVKIDKKVKLDDQTFTKKLEEHLNLV